MISKSRPGRLVSTFSLALSAVLLVAAFAAANASALSISSPGDYSVNGGASSWTTTQGTFSTCAKTAGSGKFSSGSTGQIDLALQGCKLGGSLPCTTSGQASGTIRTATLNTQLVYLDAAKTEFGLLLTPPVGSYFAEFTCWGIPVKWSGSLIGKITSPGLNVESTTATLSFQAAGTTQTYHQVEGTGNYHLTELWNGTPYEMGYAGQDTLTFPGKKKFIP